MRGISFAAFSCPGGVHSNLIIQDYEQLVSFDTRTLHSAVIHSISQYEENMNTRILVVDDEKDFLEMIINRLLKRGYETHGSLSAEKALKLMESHEYDVIILDVKMPGGMDGLEAYKKMKQMQPLVQIIFLTGHGSVELCQQGLHLGAFDYLLKPADFEEVIDRLEKASLKKRQNDTKDTESEI